jgi:hypothetical protein
MSKPHNSGFHTTQDNWRWGRVRGILKQGIQEILLGPTRQGTRIVAIGSHVTNISDDTVLFKLYITDAPVGDKVVTKHNNYLIYELMPGESLPIPSYVLEARDTIYMSTPDTKEAVTFNVQYQETI